jgi:4-hydroxybenzoate polyprenyltransferase
MYGAADGAKFDPWAVAACFMAFAFASSACYVVNDVRDRDADKMHPRKMHRPVASGAVAVGVAHAFVLVLLALAAACVVVPRVTGNIDANRQLWTGGLVAMYVINTMLYSLRLKHVVIVDVLSLALGFVLRVLGGCAIAGVEPSGWLLNCTFFVSMFLALGKRLGEMRSLGENASAARGVLKIYTIDFLRMGVVVTAVAALVTYASYAQAQGKKYEFHAAGWGFNLLWLTMLPATYGLLRAIVQLERGKYDDPTELAWKDNGFRLSVLLFGLLTGAAMLMVRLR